LEGSPANAAAHTNLGSIELKRGRHRDAERHFRAALASSPDDEKAMLGLSTVLVKLGQTDEAAATSQRLIDLYPDNTEAYSILLFALNYSNTGNSEVPVAMARRYGKLLTRTAERQYTDWITSSSPARLRVGFVSGDLYSHPVGYFLEGLLRELDSSRVEIFAYVSRPDRADALSQRLQAHCAAWKNIDALDDDAAAAMIHADGVHILISLAGHTGDSRLPIFARKPAPVQANWLGYFATTGVAEIDWFVGDPNVCPPGDEPHFTEKIWRLPETYLCFTPPTVDVPVSPLPALKNGHITFGCFNHIGKLNDAVVALWSRILKQSPDARLLLKAQQLGDVAMIKQTRARFAAHGVADRVLLEGPSSRTDYFSAYGRIDIALDPFPYPGGTTSVEALWMGVPVLTLRGNRFLSRAGENIMKNLGLPAWIAQDEAEYLSKTVALTADLSALATLRSELRNRALTSPMFDAPRFARFFEEALWGMWQTKNQGNTQ
jgi:protein O-GlcNAc transferase